MAYDWGSLGSSLSGYGSVLSSIGTTVTGIMASKEMKDIARKYQSRFLLLEQQKAAAQDKATQEMIELEKMKVQHQMELEEESEREKARIFQEWLYAKRGEPVEGFSTGMIVIGGIALFLIFMMIK